MFSYYLELALRSFRRSPGLTALMVLAIGFGVAASMTTFSVFRAVSGDPIPWKSHRLFVPQVDVWGPAERGKDGEPPAALDYRTATEEDATEPKTVRLKTGRYDGNLDFLNFLGDISDPGTDEIRLEQLAGVNLSPDEVVRRFGDARAILSGIGSHA